MLKVLIGIPVMDNVEITRTCLQYLEKYTETERLGLEVSLLIIDNGSQEDIFGLLRNEFEPVLILISGVDIVWEISLLVELWSMFMMKKLVSCIFIEMKWHGLM